MFFIFWQIGDNKEDDFFDRLDRDERIQDVVCCRKENLANRMNADPNQGGRYNGQVSWFSSCQFHDSTPLLQIWYDEEPHVYANGGLAGKIGC